VRSEAGAVVIALSLGAAAQHVPLPGDWVMDGACGSVEYVDFIPVPNQIRTYTDKRKPLADVELKLYRWEEGKACCEGSGPVASTITNKKRTLCLRRVRARQYWVVARWKQKDYEFPAIFNPRDKVKSDCANQGFQIDSQGTFQGFRTIRVD
jgi:hypothetical protein